MAFLVQVHLSSKLADRSYIFQRFRPIDVPAAFQTHMLYLSPSNNRDRFSCAILQANAGGGHSPSLQQPLCRAEFNTGDDYDLAVDRAGNLTGDALGRHPR